MNDEHCFGALNNQFDAAIPFEGKLARRRKAPRNGKTEGRPRSAPFQTMIPIQVITVTSCCDLEGVQSTGEGATEVSTTSDDDPNPSNYRYKLL